MTANGAVDGTSLSVSTTVAEHRVTVPEEAAAVAPQQLRWTPRLIVWSAFLFIAAGFAEIGGGWLVFQAIRVDRPWWWALLGAHILVVYGFIPTLQPISNFGRVFAVYGGFFIIMSYGWGWLLSSERPDRGDFIGAGIAIGGVAIAWFWPRKTQKRSEREAPLGTAAQPENNTAEQPADAAAAELN